MIKHQHDEFKVLGTGKMAILAHFSAKTREKNEKLAM